MFVYLLRCADGSLYTGCTPDLDRRYAEHRAGKGAKYTKSHPPVAIAAALEVPTRSDALRLEYRIKALGKQKKEQLLLDAPAETMLGIPAVRFR